MVRVHCPWVFHVRRRCATHAEEQPINPDQKKPKPNVLQEASFIQPRGRIELGDVDFQSDANLDLNINDFRWQRGFRSDDSLL